MEEQERGTIAAKRGVQTFRDGLIAAAVLAVITALGQGLVASSWQEWLGNWQVWTWASFQALGTGVVAYIIRRYQDDAGFK